MILDSQNLGAVDSPTADMAGQANKPRPNG